MPLWFRQFVLSNFFGQVVWQYFGPIKSVSLGQLMHNRYPFHLEIGRNILPEQYTENHGYVDDLNVQWLCGIHTMSVHPELLWVPPPGPDYIRVTLVVLYAFLLLKLQHNCSIVIILRIERYILLYLEVFRSKRTNNNLLMVDDAPGLYVDVFQGPTYHIVIRHDSRPHNYLM